MGAHLRHAARDWTSDGNRGNGVELMPVHKRKYRSGKVVWYYQFAPPGSTRQNQNLITGSGFATKQAAVDAEVARRIEEQKKHEMAKAGAAGVAAAMPTTMAMLLAEFMKQHAQ